MEGGKRGKSHLCMDGLIQYLLEMQFCQAIGPMSESKDNPYFIGVNLDNTSVYAIAVSDVGKTLAESSCPFDLAKHQPRKDFLEQPCEVWWQAACFALGHLTRLLRNEGFSPELLAGISVSSPPGTLAVLNRAGQSIYPAMMADDARAEEQAARLNMIGQEHVKKVGVNFRATDAIAKIVWFKEAEPDLYEHAVFAHQADYVLGCLKGKIDITDPTIAATTGFDPCDNCWPDWLDYDMYLSVRERLPLVGQMGQRVGQVTVDAAKATGLPVGLPVVLGCNSQTASFLSSGVKNPGDFFTVFDDVMRFDGISNSLIRYPHNIVKMNRLPDKDWFFSTQANTGTEWINVWFSELFALENIAQIDQLLPTRYLAYPNVRRGEVFPFNTNSAEGFISPATDNRLVQFAACVQGTALLERMIYATIDEMADHSGTGVIYTIGPWCRSDIWMQCRADITERTIHRLPYKRGADFGTAVLAAIGTKYDSLKEASDFMVHIEKSFFPNPARMGVFKECYTNFLTTMEEQGYLL